MKGEKKTDAEFWREYLIEKRKAEEEQENADTKLSIAIWFCMIAVFVLVAIHTLLK